MSEFRSSSSEAISRAAAEVASRPDNVSAVAYADLIRLVQGFLYSHYPWFQREDVEDLASLAIMRLLVASREGRIDPNGKPGGYLLSIARSVAVDHMRAARPTLPLDRSTDSWESPRTWQQPAEESVARVLDRAATVSRVRDALAAARASGDATLYKVAIYMLDQAELTGDLPSNRQTAEYLGLSHTGVAKALRRLRSYLDEGLDAGV